MNKNSRIYIAGHAGLIGSAMLRRLQVQNYHNLLTASHADLDLTDKSAVERFFAKNRPDFVVLAAGKVGGIVDNVNYPADFMEVNLSIQLNVLRAARENGVKRLIFFGSSCMYPRECVQPMTEAALFSGRPEPTSMAYAISKIAGLQMCLAYNQQDGERRFLPVIPNSAFGPNDNFGPSGHVLSALIRRFHEAKVSGAQEVTLWGSGNPRREFVHVDDIADACVALLTGALEEVEFPINLGTGVDYSIQELAEEIKEVVGYKGDIFWDISKPDGAPRKLLDSARLRSYGWSPKVQFREGLKHTYKWFLENATDYREDLND